MRRPTWSSAILATVLVVAAGSPALAEGPGLNAAQKKALSPCATCHDLSADKKALVGPPLWGLYGSKPVSAGIPFAKWDKDSLSTWLDDPAKVKSGTLMTFQVKNPKKRAEVINALQALQ